ncbi:MAG TPA: hypothetical protein P5519_01395 [Spirochaetia bacterium]|nr:hypothetical protein [Spirochaetales bacterium]HRS64527.1 hypothetical protein [Spirochaetia bacterium]HOT59875.1 hypothetical protein [Spirochaetales bacterium]HPD80001.1 hypothetical protein [Spirochaetales bacterium]HQK34885.1 hypothetical protein [Spirochaetales bacterium]
MKTKQVVFATIMPIAVLAMALVALVAGCALLDLFNSVKFNTIIEGEIEYSDEHSEDSNDLMFYWDYYEVTLKTGKSYSIELWTDPGCPIHFECDDLGQDLGAWSDGDGTWDGYLKYTIPSSFTGKLGFDFYLRADFVGSRSWYKFRVNEN